MNRSLTLAIVVAALAPAEVHADDSRFDLLLEESIVTGGAADFFTMRATLMARVWERLRLGAAGEMRARDGVEPHTMGFGLVSWYDERWALEAGLGGSDGGLTPTLSGWIEPGLRAADPLWISLRYWRLDFAGPNTGAHVLAPGVVATLGPVDVDLRYWLGLEDDGCLTHAAMARVRWSPSGVWTFELGGGGGTATDYLDPRAEPSASQRLALAGLRISPSGRHRVNLGYLLRHESTTDGSLVRHELSLAWKLTL